MSDTAQPTPEPYEKKSRGLGSYVLWAFVALMVYVLSSGPLMWLKTGHRLPLAYEPLAWAYIYTPLHKPLGMYWHLWYPGSWDPDGEIHKGF